MLMYQDQKKFPAILSASRLQLPGTALQNKPGTQSILTEKNLSGYTKANPNPVLSRSGNIGSAAERADQIIKTNAATAKPIDAAARMLTRITGVERLTRAIYNRAGYLSPFILNPAMCGAHCPSPTAPVITWQRSAA